MGPEQGIQAAILAYLRMKHILCWKNNTAGIYVRSRNTYIPSHAPGVSDILGVLPGGRALAIEVKAPAPHQQHFIDSVNETGGLAVIARSVEEVHRAIQASTRT